MKLIELHILQSFPVSCLNRDDVGAPKSAVFGGVNRARLSSQCLKRAIRLAAHELQPALFQGERSRLVIEPLAKLISKHGVGAERALQAAKDFCHNLATYDEQAFKTKAVHKVKTLMFFSPREQELVAKELADAISKSGADAKKLEKRVGSAAAKALEAKLVDAADIALFGRMVANDHSLTVEGAAMFGHALSVHKADNDIDFWTAVDDRQKEDPTVAEEDRAGSGGMGTLEFTSALYYRYAALNLDLLWSGKPERPGHLETLPLDDRKKVVDSFIRSVLTAVPGARKNSMNAHTFPSYVVGSYKEKGQPVQLVNAFEQSVYSRNGFEAPTARKMLLHRADLHEAFNLKETESLAAGTQKPTADADAQSDGRQLTKAMIPEWVSLNTFCERLVNHVL